MPPEVGRNVATNVKDRISASITLIEDQINLGRRTIRETRERIGIPGKEPTLPREAGVPGARASLAEMPLGVVLKASDNVTKWALRQAEITRRWVR